MNATLLGDAFEASDATARFGESGCVTAFHELPSLSHSSSPERLRLRLYAALALLDGTALFVAFALAGWLREGRPFHSTGMDMFVVLLPIFIGIAANSRAYSLDVLMRPRIGVKRAARSLMFAIAAVIGTVFYLKVSTDFSRVITAIGTAGSLAFVCSGRHFAGRFIGRRYGWQFTNEIVVVDGGQIPAMHGQRILFADQAGLSPSTGDPLLLDKVGKLLRNCDRVVLACAPERRAAWAAMLKGSDINVEMLAPELDELGALEIGRFGGSSTILVSRGPLGLRDRLIKRTFDLALTLPTLVLLFPLFGIIALAIKLDSPGPVFFRQERMGKGNRIFHVLKFRSMRTERTDWSGTRSASRSDDRVTRVGRFLRATSLDELPQLLNVFAGTMSIVGPRPHALASTAEDLLFWDIEARYWERHVVKPGITGLAQVRGFRGATFQRSDLSSRLQADLEYLSGWSIWRDIGIVAATLRVLRHQNAF